MTAIRMNTTHVKTAPAGTAGFRAWRRRRPLIGGILLILSGFEMFFSGQLDLGNIKVQLGFEGFQATVIPALLALLGLLIIVTPAHRMFYGIFALVLAVYSLVGVNLGGFVIGMLLAAVGGVLTVAWRPTVSPAAHAASEEEPAAAATAPAIEAPASASVAERPVRDHGGVVHAEAVDFATLRARAATRRGGGAASSTPAEPRPFVRSR